MPLDDRIRQLTETIIQETRAPLEKALHGLLGEVMTLASADREQAVQSALSEAALGHQSALAAVREEAERRRVDVDAMRAQFDRELEASQAALREQLEREHGERLGTLREQLDREHEERLAALRAEWTGEHDGRVADLRESLGREHESALESLRGNLVEAHASALADARASISAEHETSLAELRGQLEAEHGAKLAELRGQLEAEHGAKLAELRGQLEAERDAALGAAGADIERTRAEELAGLREELGRTHESALKAALQAAGEESDRAHQAELESLEARLRAEHDSAIQGMRDELAAREESSVSSARLAAEAAAAAGLTGALAAAEHARSEADARADELARELAQVRGEAESARQAAADQAQRAHDAEERSQLIHAVDRQSDLACSDRTLGVFRRLDSAQSLSEVLQILTEQAASESGRSALFLVSGSRLRGWHARGMAGADVAAIDAVAEPGTLFEAVLSSNAAVSTAEAPLGTDPNGIGSILALPPGRAALAVPISVGGRVVGILYADDGGEQAPAVPSSWPEVAEILARHAGHCLEVLTISRAATLAGRVQHEAHQQTGAGGTAQDDERREEESARRYARLLISEIKLYNEMAVEQGRQDRNLNERLGTDIERARRLYEEKIPAAVRQRVNCFDQEVVRTLAGGDPGLLGRT
jgi:hypothetical protein